MWSDNDHWLSWVLMFFNLAGRMRRKKCDEEGSECRACRRNGLTCIWQSGVEPGKDRKGSDSKALVKSPPRKSPPLSPRFSTLENTPRDALFQYFAGSILPQLMMPGSPPTGATDLLKLGVQFPCVRDSFLACAALFRSSSEEPPPHDALGYYSGALCATRKMIQQSAVYGTEDWFYIQTLSLCIFEVRQTTPDRRCSKANPAELARPVRPYLWSHVACAGCIAGHGSESQEYLRDAERLDAHHSTATDVCCGLAVSCGHHGLPESRYRMASRRRNVGAGAAIF